MREGARGPLAQRGAVPARRLRHYATLPLPPHRRYEGGRTCAPRKPQESSDEEGNGDNGIGDGTGSASDDNGDDARRSWMERLQEEVQQERMLAAGHQLLLGERRHGKELLIKTSPALRRPISGERK